MTNQTSIGIIQCMQETALGDIVIGLTIYSILTSLFIFLLVLIILKILKKDKNTGGTNGTTGTTKS